VHLRLSPERDAFAWTPLISVVCAEALAATLLVGQYTLASFALGDVAMPTTWHQVLNAWLLLALGVAEVAWAFLYARRRTSPTTGVGLALAAYGLLVRVTWEHFLTWFGLGWEELTSGTSFPVALSLARTAGLAAYGMGLALVGAALLRERIARRRAPPWAAPLV
jgi:dipeptide/tripeptide permease